MRKLSLIFKNITKLIKKQRIFFAALVIAQIVACLSIFFSVGAIHNTRNEQKDIDIRTMFFEVSIEPIELGEMQKKVEYVLSVIPPEIISYASIKGYSDMKYYDMEQIYDYGYSYYAQMYPNDSISAEQIQNGEKIVEVKEPFPPDEEKTPKVGDKIEFCGTEYTVISVGDYVADYIIPITALDPNLPAHRFRVALNVVPEMKLAKDIEKIMNEIFPVTNENIVPDIPDLVTVQFNRNMIPASVIVIIIVVLNLSYCYCYLFIKRKKMLSMYMICGSSNSAAADMMISESVIISLMCYLVAVCLIKPFTHSISEIYPAAELLYSFKFFMVVGVIYIAFTVIILKVMFSMLLKKSAVELKRGV
ncbi:MAG: hypothetical protein K2G83_00345 [Ruminococcus sp.]|nr:hypothetical protein [Ruminococcus sp.]